MLKFFLIAGEASGDLHASNLIKAIRAQEPEAFFVGLGGDKMREAGCTLYQDYRHMAFMGFVAVIQNLGEVRRNFRIAEQALLKERPDVLILIDYPSFNLRIAAFCKKHLPDTKIVYYIPPKIWAWKKRRVHTIARLCDAVLGIFPFEPAFYARYGYQCTYVGNPTAELLRHTRLPKRTHQQPSEHAVTNTEKPFIALLPGSRQAEIKHCLPMMLAAARAFPNYPIVVTAAPGLDDAFYLPYLKDGESLRRDTYQVLASAQAAVVNSGTATLETALLGCPQEAVYHVATGRVLGFLKPLLFTIPYFTLVNIILGKEVIKEQVAYHFTERDVREELDRLLHDEHYRAAMQHSYAELSTALGSSNASQTAAEEIIRLLK